MPESLVNTNMQLAANHAVTEMNHFARLFALGIREGDEETKETARVCLNALQAGYIAAKNTVYNSAIERRRAANGNGCGTQLTLDF